MGKQNLSRGHVEYKVLLKVKITQYNWVSFQYHQQDHHLIIFHKETLLVKTDQDLLRRVDLVDRDQLHQSPITFKLKRKSM
jgi:hypothetical protein